MGRGNERDVLASGGVDWVALAAYAYDAPNANVNVLMIKDIECPCNRYFLLLVGGDQASPLYIANLISRYTFYR